MPKDYELHIYGDGEYREFVIEHTKKNRNINYYGFKDRETVAEDQSNSVATIVSSECYETFGMAIPECFSMGIPVLATDVGNPGQMVKESGGGRTFISQDINSLKEAIDEVILNREKYASAAFEYYKLYLNAENNYKRLMDIYVKARHFG